MIFFYRLTLLGFRDFQFDYYSYFVVVQEVSRLLLGLNCGKPLQQLDLPDVSSAFALEHDFDIQVDCITS